MKTFDEQTRASWAKWVESFDELPEIYRALFPVRSDGQRNFPYAILTPRSEGFLHREHEKLVYALDDTIHIVTQSKHHLASVCYPIDGISYVETGRLLLYAWMRIEGMNNRGDFVATTFKFNTASDYLFKPLLKKIRPEIGDTGQSPMGLELAKFDRWNLANLKFMNYARQSIPPGGIVIDSILQQEICQDIVRYRNLAWVRYLSPTHAYILTDQELIVIQETLRSSLTRDAKYDGSWTYIPLSKIAGSSITRRRDGLLALSIQLPGNKRIESLFSPSNQDEVERLHSRVRAALRPSAPTHEEGYTLQSTHTTAI